MTLHIGTKIVSATPMNRADYNAYRGWTLPIDENGADEGYLVEYMDGGKPNDDRHTGYISWSPKAQFDAAYREITGLTFGLAIEAMKKGAKVARAGWNGKGMWIIYVPGTKDVALRAGTPYEKALRTETLYENARHVGVPPIELLPHIDMWTVNAQGRRAMLPGWLASQTDMLAEDWQIVQGEKS